ncbi:MAG: thioredoxin domain-containing protein [Butyricimonas faecalis]
MLTKAKTENKTIFVDVYTQWCGPCKHVSENVFHKKNWENTITPTLSISK